MYSRRVLNVKRRFLRILCILSMFSTQAAMAISSIGYASYNKGGSSLRFTGPNLVGPIRFGVGVMGSDEDFYAVHASYYRQLWGLYGIDSLIELGSNGDDFSLNGECGVAVSGAPDIPFLEVGVSGFQTINKRSSGVLSAYWKFIVSF